MDLSLQHANVSVFGKRSNYFKLLTSRLLLIARNIATQCDGCMVWVGETPRVPTSYWTMSLLVRS